MRFDQEKLQLIKKLLLENPKMRARVGIMGESDARKKSDSHETDAPGNAQIGAWHEYGIPEGSGTRMPQRSFLRMPIILKMQEYLKKGLDKKTFNASIEDKSLAPMYRRLGVIGRKIVLDAFASGGFGQWAPLAPYTIAHKKVAQILVETQDLRNSITFEVVE